MQEQLEIRIDGELVVPTATEQALETARSIGHGTLQLFNRLGQHTASTIAEALKPVILDITDHRNHSTLRQQYFAAKRAGEVATVASMFELDVE